MTLRLQSILYTLASLTAACGGMMPTDSEIGKSSGETNDGPAHGDEPISCLQPDDVNSPWLVGLDATARGAISRSVEKGLMLVKAGKCGTFKMLPNCYIPGIDYRDEGSTELRVDSVEITSRTLLQRKIPLAVTKYSRAMKTGDQWSLDYIEAGAKSFEGNLSEIDWSLVRGSCRQATHYVYMVTQGAFQLSVAKNADNQMGGYVGPADWQRRAERQTLEKSEDGDYGKCAASDSPQNASCRGLIKIWVEPIPEGLLSGAKTEIVEETRVRCPAGSRFIEGQGCVGERIDELAQANEEFEGVQRDQLDPEGENERRQIEARRALLNTLKKLLEGLRPLIVSGKLTVRIADYKSIIVINSASIFRNGSGEISEEGAGLMASLVRSLEDFKEREFRIGGHTDNVPIKSKRFKSNWEMSTSRAEVIAKYLFENGIERKKITSAGYADTQPIASNDTAEGRAMNRRIEIGFQLNADEFQLFQSVLE